MHLVERWLQVSIVCMAVLGTWMMSLGGHIPYMFPLMVVVAICGLVFTDILGMFYLHRIIVNLVAIAAMGLTLTDFLKHDSTQQLLLIAYLLISWEAVMLFQRKTARVYWCIAVLSLLQVVVASVLNIGMPFGMLMLVYLFVGFFALVFFFLAREFHRVEDRRRAAARSRETIVGVSDDSQRMVVARLPLGAMFRSVTALGLTSVLFAIVFFYGAPRIGGNWRNANATRAQTGFTTEVSLKEMGEILQSQQQVMRVSFVDHRTDNADYDIFSEPYFYGAVLTNYAGGRWEAAHDAYPRRLPLVYKQLMAAQPNQDFLRMNVTLEPTTSPTLFTVLPCFRVNQLTPSEVNFHENRQHLIRNPHPNDGVKFRYTIATTGLRRGLQNLVRPYSVRKQWPNNRPHLELTGSDRRDCLRITRRRFPSLIQHAEEVLADMPDATTYERARRLQVSLRDNTDFSYTLNFEEIARTRDPTLDPIEDFMRNHKRGHCEYYASALILMLRSQDIPARMVVGFHGGERNELTGDIRVLQSHAHAWVEAYLEPDEIPEAHHLAMAGSPGGGWLRLDPTPANEAEGPTRTRLDDVLDYAQLLWTDYVLEMDPQKQRATLGATLGDGGPLPVDGWMYRMRRSTRETITAVRDWVGGNWFSWRAGVLASGVCLALFAAIRLLYPVFAWLRQQLGGASRRRTPRVTVDFYLRLEKLLKQVALIRQPSQTHLEFAEDASASLLEAGLPPAAANVPRQVAQVYYDIRYGQTPLTPPQAEVVNVSLDTLADAIRHRKKTVDENS